MKYIESSRKPLKIKVFIVLLMWNQMFKKRFFKSDLDTSVLQSFTILVVGIVSQGV